MLQRRPEIFGKQDPDLSIASTCKQRSNSFAPRADASVTARHLCARLKTKGHHFRLRVAMPSAPANLQLPRQDCGRFHAPFADVLFSHLTPWCNYTLHHQPPPLPSSTAPIPGSYDRNHLQVIYFTADDAGSDMPRLDFISQLYRVGKKRIRGEGRGFVGLEEGAEERTRLEISSWQPFSRRVIRIYFQLYTRISRLQYS